jgi:hypothetical protein
MQVCIKAIAGNGYADDHGSLFAIVSLPNKALTQLYEFAAGHVFNQATASSISADSPLDNLLSLGLQYIRPQTFGLSQKKLFDD